MNETPEEIAAIIARVSKAKAAVLKWMDEEGAAGRFRQNHQSPGWGEYVAANQAFQELANPPVQS